MKAIKVVKRVGDRLVSQYLQSLLEKDEAGQERLGPEGLLNTADIKAAMVEYIPSEWVSPKPEAGPLCAWKLSTLSTRDWIVLTGKYEVWECEVRLWRQKLPRVTFSCSPVRRVAAVWPPVDDWSYVFWSPKMLSRETLLCEAIKLTRRIK